MGTAPLSFWKKPQTAKLLLGVGIMIFLFYILTLYVIKGVYKYRVVGAVSELLSFPMLFLLILLPVALVMALLKGPKAVRLYYFVACFLWTLTLVILSLH
jgi:hypothetical protein